MNKRRLPALLMACLAGPAWAAMPVPVDMQLVDQNGPVRSVGTIEASQSAYGVVFTPHLEGLPPGVHGFHLHANADCGPKLVDGKNVPAGAAGGHYDPAGTGRHEGPWGDGHLGDLPALYVGTDGRATQPVLAPRLKLSDLGGHSLMVHAGGDNHADMPAPLGGGGARVACGVIKK